MQAEKEVLPIVSQCLDGMVDSAESIDEKEVSERQLGSYHRAASH